MVSDAVLLLDVHSPKVANPPIRRERPGQIQCDVKVEWGSHGPDRRSFSRLRRLCMALPEVEERVSHGEPAWFIRGKRQFVTYADHHHDDRVAFWCSAPEGAQHVLTTTDPGRYFIPPYVGGAGMGGVLPGRRGRLGGVGGDCRRRLCHGGARSTQRGDHTRLSFTDLRVQAALAARALAVSRSRLNSSTK